ncbi:MAG TPA: response regulator [Geobacteraceae bacterium]
MDKVLIIDDSIVTRALIGDILGGTYALDFQENGAAGLAAAKDFLPGLILLDIHLPDIDGYHVCRALKQEEATGEIPIIFITSMGSEQERVKGFEAGAEDYVVKPFYPGELLARVKAHLATSRAKAQAVELERLKIFKEMAVALSHEINNPLTTLYGYLHLLRNDTGDSQADTLAMMRAELDRVRQITEKLARASQVAETSYHREITMIDLHNI